MRVVVIDDDVVFLNTIERFLKREHFEVLVLRNTIGSVTNRVRAFRPHVVMVDINMPHLPGDALIRLMKREVPEAAYIVLSGLRAAMVRRVEIETGADKSVMKSTNLQQLAHIIRSFEHWRR